MDYSEWNLDKLRRKRDQAWELAGLARYDSDTAEEQRHTQEARALCEEITRRLKA